MSIKKIAEKVGTSPATVSRVLNNPNYKCQQDDLRRKIWKAAIELNYAPNEAARRLKKGNQTTDKNYYINVLMTRMDGAQSDPFFSELLRVVESEIHNHFCILSRVWYNSLFSNDRKCKRENLGQLIDKMYEETENKNDGLIIIGKCNKDALRLLGKKYKNIVSINRNSTNYEVDEVLCDGEKTASIAVEHLVKLGHKNIAYVGNCRNEARYRGYMAVLAKYDIDLIPEFVVETKQTESEAYETMELFLREEEAPTAIYCANDITAIGMLKCLHKYRNLYFRPSIIANDDIEESSCTNPMLTTVRLPKEEMGKFALYLLLDRISGGHKGVIRMELEGKLIVRSSCVSIEDANRDYYI